MVLGQGSLGQYSLGRVDGRNKGLCTAFPCPWDALGILLVLPVSSIRRRPHASFFLLFYILFSFLFTYSPYCF